MSHNEPFWMGLTLDYTGNKIFETLRNRGSRGIECGNPELIRADSQPDLPVIRADLRDLRLLSLPRPPIKIYRDVTFGLALQARIAEKRGPSFVCAVVFQPPILHGFMPALADIMQNDPGTFIPGHGKTQSISASLWRHAGTSAGIAKIAEIPQLGL
jgi:hypothetical protein